MYKNEYQGGPSVEILSCQGKDPLNKWRISGGSGAAKRIYEKDLKSFVYHLEGSTATSKLQLPKDGTKQTLFLTQRYLTFQVFIPFGKDFSVELSMTDSTNSKRRLLMSTSIREMSITPLHAKLNLSIIIRDNWLNLCFDLVSLLSDIFLKQKFKSLDSIVVAGSCKIRKIFTMRNQPPDTTESDSTTNSPINGLGDAQHGRFQLENVPPNLQFASTVAYMTQVITVKKVQDHMKSHRPDLRETSGYCSSSSDDLNQSWQVRHGSKISARDIPQPATHIAFGTRVRLDSTGSSSGNKTSRSSKNSARMERTVSNSSYPAGPTFKKPLEVRRDKQNQNNSSNLISARDDPVVPSPPPSAQSLNIQRNPRTNRLKSPMARKSMNHSTSNESANSIQYLPTSLVNLVDELEIVGESSDDDSGKDNDSVFTFSSRPHIAHRKVDDTVSPELVIDRTHLTNHNGYLDEDFLRSDSSDSDEDMAKRIIRNTPSPRSGIVRSASPRDMIHKSLTSSPKVSAEQINHSIRIPKSTNISSPNRLYNSAKYTENPVQETKKSIIANNQSPSVAKSIVNRSIASLRGSDATLTESVDTLVHNSMTKENESDVYPDDSLEVNNSTQSREMKNLSEAKDIPTLSEFSPQRDFELTSDLSPKSEGNVSHRSVTISRKTLREIPHKSDRISPRIGEKPESSSFQVGSWSESFEGHMLSKMKREQEEEMTQEEEREALRKQASNTGGGLHTGGFNGNLTYEDNESGDESFDASWSTWKQPPAMDSEAYAGEMEGSVPPKNMDTLAISLNQSNPRNWANLLSPPIVLPSERAKQEKDALSDVESGGNVSDALGLSDGSTVSGHSTSVQESDDEEMLDLMYDPCLNCYFDPKSGRYYELKG
uniref:protein CFAP20DC-like n=1 Tax=Styela clava TaxID=7725 RepID=UPI00193A1934|nr:protein CFAP20DC-like [Styela clava]